MPGPEGAGLLLWFHGGAYCLGSPRTHAAMVTALAARAGVGAVLPDYRLAPEHPFPAAVEDARAAWEGLLSEGWPPGRVAVGGDSAGGGLALALVHGLLAEGAAAPACVVVFSPWTDMTLSGASVRELAWRDAFLPARRLPDVRDLYLAGADPRDPRASPHLGRFRGGPPTLIQASRAEILRDDAVAVAERMRGDGVEVALELSPGVPHVWQIYHGRLPEADAAIGRAAAFIAAHLKSA
jgi:acetyl esterase/lipase